MYTLNQQYRMHPAISHFPRRIFYDGSLLDRPNVLDPEYENPLQRVILSKVPTFQVRYICIGLVYSFVLRLHADNALSCLSFLFLKAVHIARLGFQRGAWWNKSIQHRQSASCGASLCFLERPYRRTIDSNSRCRDYVIVCTTSKSTTPLL